MTTLQQLKILNEVFDKPWSYEKDEDMTNRIKKYYSRPEWSNHTINNIAAHKLEGNNGHLISIKRDGLLEVHHLDKDENSGVLHKDSTNSNPRFYGTMIHHLKTYGLDKGRPVRVSTAADTALDKHHTAIAEKLSKKHDYRLKHNYEDLPIGKFHNIEIHHKNKIDLSNIK